MRVKTVKIPDRNGGNPTAILRFSDGITLSEMREIIRENSKPVFDPLAEIRKLGYPRLCALGDCRVEG